MLELSKVSKTFQNSYKPVLQDIAFKLLSGEFCTLIGSNGSGKSTLLKTISGEYSVDSGQISLNDQNITNYPFSFRAKFIGQITQDTTVNLVEEMTLLENIALSYSKISGPKLKFLQSSYNKAFELASSLNYGLEQYINTPLINLSGGQKQMISTVMAFVSKPKLLLLDEHTSALDPKMQSELMEYTANKIKTSNVTALMVTHNLKDAINYGDRLIMLHQGKIVLNLDKKHKDNLTVEGLLELFHQYEDETLVH